MAEFEYQPWKKIILVMLMTFAVIATVAPVTSGSSQSTITYYDGQRFLGYVHWGLATYDVPTKGATCVSPGPYPYEFNLSEPLHAYLQIRHALWTPNSVENYLTIYLDGASVLEANTTGLDWYPGGDGIELIDLGTVPTGTHNITMSATYPDYYLMDWFKVLELVYDVAVINIVPANTQVYPTWKTPLNIMVTVLNNGTEPANFNVAIYYNDTLIGNLPVTNLGVGMQENLTFSWGLTGVAWGLYDIKANVTILDIYPDINAANNELVFPNAVKVKMPGDVDGNGDCKTIDAALFAASWWTVRGDLDYNEQCDFNGDGNVKTVDAAIFAAYWWKTTNKY